MDNKLKDKLVKITDPTQKVLVSDATRISIERQIILEKMKGNHSFKDVWLGNGWLSKDEDGKVTFTTTKQLPY